MTAPLPATFSVEHDCDRRCRTEINVDGIAQQTSINGLRERARLAHETAHLSSEKVFTVGPSTVRALSLGRVAGVLA